MNAEGRVYYSINPNSVPAKRSAVFFGVNCSAAMKNKNYNKKKKKNT